ncbi:MAG: hypothetical protein R6V50_01615 [Thermoplasmatota archaeon]
MNIEDDPVLGRFFDSAEKKARWMARVRLLYLLWIVFVVVGVLIVLLWYVLH